MNIQPIFLVTLLISMLVTMIDNNNLIIGEHEKITFINHSKADVTLTETVATKKSATLKSNPINNVITQTGYWQTVHSIESKQGKLLYRPKNKYRNCTYTSSPCGHHQLTAQALKDIGCKSPQCKKDRLDYEKSLQMSKKLLALNEKRLKHNGFSDLEDYQKYLMHQQGANGIKNIMSATEGKKLLSKKIKRNMANNSPYSYKQLRKMGSQVAAKKFMQHWKQKWNNEKILVAGIQTVASDNVSNPSIVSTFSDDDIQLALNYRF